jgi:hypothetical protein
VARAWGGSISGRHLHRDCNAIRRPVPPAVYPSGATLVIRMEGNQAMTVQRQTVTRTDQGPYVDPATTPATPVTRTSSVVETANVSPSGGEMTRRIVVLIFGIIQLLIGLRIVLLLLDAREGNDLVSFILNTSQVFVAPFVGIFNTDALHASGSILDIAAIAALVGWSILEVVVLWAVNLFRREPV